MINCCEQKGFLLRARNIMRAPQGGESIGLFGGCLFACLLAFLRERECTSTSTQGDLVVSGHSGVGITGGCVSLSEQRGQEEPILLLCKSTASS